MRIRVKIKHILAIFTLLHFSNETLGQSVVQEMSSISDDTRTSELFVEQIKTIGNSKKIFILTNDNQLLQKGDFVSLLIEGNLVTRALVAKTNKDRAGIKMMKIYSLSLWRQLRRGLSVQIIRGDDSYYQKNRVAKKESEIEEGNETLSISSEEDLYNTKFLNDLESEDKKRILPNDNLLAAHYGIFQGLNSDGEAQNYAMWSGSWAYQIASNSFLEGSFGVAQMNGFPIEGVNAAAYNFTGRLKYTFALPLYSYAQPYIGFQNVSVQVSDSDLNSSEEERIADVEKSGIVFGVTLLRRLVPGWFIKADLGTDIINIGFAIEF